MSSPIAIPRVTVESTDATTHSPSTSPKYVPVHRRQASDASTRSISPVSSRAPSPTPSDTSSWRSHAPASPQGRRFATKAFTNHHNHQHVKADLPHTNTPNHIPQSSSIPSTTNTNNIPFVYSISDLLSLSSSPASLPPSQLQTFAEVVLLLSLPINNDKAAVRRRRNGRRNNSSKSAKNAKDAPVEVRRTRHGHDTWGWQTQHQGDELQVPWRHEQSTPVTVVV